MLNRSESGVQVLNSIPDTLDSSQMLVSNSSSREAASSDLRRQPHARTRPQLKIVKNIFYKNGWNDHEILRSVSTNRAQGGEKDKVRGKLTSWRKGVCGVSSDTRWFEEHVFTVN